MPSPSAHAGKMWLIAACAALAFAATRNAVAQADANDRAMSFVTEQLILIATVVGAAATLPTLVDFLIDRRKRKERIALSLDDIAVADLDVRLAGLDHLLNDIADLIDRARNPETYASLKVGNEILIIGPPASGKKTLAQRIAKDAGLDRVIVVYNAQRRCVGERQELGTAIPPPEGDAAAAEIGPRRRG